MSVTPKASWPWVRTLLHSVLDPPDAESVVDQYDRVLDALSDKLPKVAEHLPSARAEILAFTTFPKQIWRQIWSNNPRKGSTRKSAATPTLSASSRTAPPSSASSAPC
jgi:putative transposase